MNISSPVLENSCKLQFGILPLDDIIGLSLVDVENLMDMLFSLLGEENFLIGVEFVKDSIDQFINELESVNIEVLKNFLLMNDTQYDLILFPFNKDLAINQ